MSSNMYTKAMVLPSPTRISAIARGAGIFLSFSEPLCAINRRGFWLEVRYSFSFGSICIEQLSGYTFLAFRRTALPTIRIRTFLPRLLVSRFDSTFLCLLIERLRPWDNPT